MRLERLLRGESHVMHDRGTHAQHARRQKNARASWFLVCMSYVFICQMPLPCMCVSESVP